MKKDHQKLTCRQVNLELMQRFDEKSLEHSSEDLRAHLPTCTNCREEFEALNALDRKLKGLSEADPGDAYWTNFLPNLRQKITRKSRQRTAKDPAWVPALAMAAFFLILAFKSPVPVAPPSWYEVQSYVTYTWGADPNWNGEYIEMEDESFAQKISSHEFAEFYLGEGSAKLFETLSDPSNNLPLDLNERIARLEEDQQNAFFDKIKTIPIIKS